MTPATRSSADATRSRPGGVRLAPALLLAAALAACGGGGSSSGPGDTTAPTVAISDGTGAAVATGNVTFTFTFSEDVGTSFTAGTVTVAGGTKGAFARVSSTVYTLVVVPTPSAAGTITVTVPAQAFTDLAGNANAAAATATQAYDTRRFQMNLPVDFDAVTVTHGLIGFGGAEDSTIVADPAGGTNQVGRVVKSGTAETWAGTTLTADGTLGLASPIPFTVSATRLSVRVRSPDVGVHVRLKVEDHANVGVSVETEALTTVANAWETLFFDFASAASGTAALNLASSYDKVSIFFNFGVAGATAGAKTYYFDDVRFAGGGGVVNRPFAAVTFDDAGVTYTLTGFGGAEDASVAADPGGGTNKVGKVVKSAAAEVWAGTTVSTGANNTVGTIPFDASNTRMTLRVWSPAIGVPVRLKVEDAANGAVTCETEAVTTVANAWETLTFDFATPAAGTAALDVAKHFDRASVFFNFGTGGAATGARTYYLDDLVFIGGGGTGGGGTAFAPVTFDDGAITYALAGFGGADDSTVVTDPAGGTNKVARVVKSATAETWAGTTVSTGPGATVGAIPFSASAKRMTLRVWSPDVGIPVRLKVEKSGAPAISVETEARTTVASAWETLTFDFAAQASGTAALNLANTYDMASVFFNFGTAGATAGAKTYYFDDLAFLP